MSYLKYTIPERELKGMGYTFQKLYAADHKTYRKKIDEYTIWLWVMEKRLEVDDWFDCTIKVIDFYKSVCNDPTVFDKHGGLKLQLNRLTGHVQHYDFAEYCKVFKTFTEKKENPWKEWKEKYEDYSEVYITKDSMEELLKEIEILTK